MMMCCISVIAAAQEAVSNVRVQQHDALLYVTYDLTARADVELHVSLDGGVTYRGPMKHVSGAVGKGIYPQKDNILIWKVADELGYVDYENAVVKIVAYPSQSDKETIPQFEGMLESRGREVYRNGNKLSVSEVKQLMKTNPYASQSYKRAIRQNKIGKILLPTGIVALTAGSMALDSDLNNETRLILGVYGVLGGGAMIINGCNLRMRKCKNNVRQSVERYNSGYGLNQNGMELKFGITGNGAGLVLLF